ncbi:MAG: four helix bundle protein [Bacteroidetes bacterium]|nr:four helix bundle protein [Bacteroidota bacterium]
MKVQTDNPVAKPTKRYDLEDRTLRFSKDVIQFVNGLPKTIANVEIGKQLVRSAGSVGANYIEANEALGKKDFVMRARIARKEAKETRYWLELVECSDALVAKQKALIQEATELLKIMSAIILKSE